MNDRTTKPRPEVETLQRARRIETRLTALCNAMGVGTNSQKPVFDAGNLQGRARVVLPSRHSTLAEVVAAIPETFDGEVDLVIGDERIATLDRAA